MRRQDIQLLAQARRGDIAARCEVGRRYLVGSDGFPQHIATGIEYLTHPSVRSTPVAAQILAECMPLEEILMRQQLDSLEVAAASGNPTAQHKLGVWLCVRYGSASAGMRWLAAASRAGHAGAELAMTALRGEQDSTSDLAVSLARTGASNALTLTLFAARAALQAHDFAHLARCVCAAAVLCHGSSPELDELLAAAVLLAEKMGEVLRGIPPERIESSLNMRAGRGDHEAAYLLGRALCGLPCGPFQPVDVAVGSNVRKGAALLLRAADAGCNDAWLHLYRLNADLRSSVSNPQMARFFLEKAAMHGQAEGQRRLGALLLREATSLEQTEQAISWLHQATMQNDVYARELLKSLVLPVAGSDADAKAAIESLRQEDPWLAMRLQLSRSFGLTKLEALCVDPAEGLRPWGLVVTRNPFIAQARLSAPRAIPATSAQALADLHQAAALFEQARQGALVIEGDLRRRSLLQRRAFARHGLDATMFFANATSMTLESLRQGPKWAYRARAPLQSALAAGAMR